MQIVEKKIWFLQFGEEKMMHEGHNTGAQIILTGTWEAKTFPNEV